MAAKKKSAASWWDDPVSLQGTTVTPRKWLHEAWLDFSDQSIADVLTEVTGLEVSKYAVTQQRQREGLRKTATGQPVIFVESEYRRYDDAPVLNVDNLLVMADIEAPFHDAEWCSDVVALAKHWNITVLLSAGDLFHFKALSSFFKRFLAEGEEIEEISDEVDAVAEVVDVLLAQFEQVHCILGNHEQRLTRPLGVHARARLLKHLLGYRFEERITFYPYYYAKIRTGMPVGDCDEWRISHPKNTSVIPARVAGRMADKFSAHYISAHGHDWGAVTSVAGRYAAACGICVDPERLDYVMLRDNLRPRMQQGAFILRDGLPVLLHPQYAPPRMYMG